jgi:Sugar (pentulose and hexulose) kinases
MPYLCLDIGSSAVKAAVVSEGGEVLGRARGPVSTSHGPGGSHEVDARQWIEGALASGRQALRIAASVGGKRPDIRAIAASGNGPTLVAVDAALLPLGPALSWLDRRAAVESVEASAAAGLYVDPSFYLPKALFMWRALSPSERARTRWFLPCPEYLVAALCGEAVAYLPDRGYEPYIWSEGLLSALGLPVQLFPPFVRPSEIVGALLPASAEGLGLEPGIPLVAGFPDFLASIVGSGAVKVGVANDRSGSSEALNLCALSAFPGREILSLPHAISPLWNLSGGLSTAGSALARVASLLGYRGVDELVADAERSVPGARGLSFLPYLAGERAPLWDTRLRGGLSGLSMEHGREDLARAACESMAYGLKLAAELIAAKGFPLELVRVSGLAARDDLLCRIKAEVLGVPVEAPEEEDCELLGDAAACALALGDGARLDESALALFRLRRRFEPSNQASGERAAYAEAFAAFKSALSGALGEASREGEGGSR